MARTDTLRNFLADIAEAIRAKTGKSETIRASEFDAEIESIPSGDASEYFVMKPPVKSSIAKLIKRAPQLDTSGTTNMAYFFNGCEALETVPQLDTSKATNMDYFFCSCTTLETVPQLDTSRVTSMQSFLQDCTALKTVPQLDAGNANLINNIFYKCTALENLGGLKDLGKRYTQKTYNYSYYTLGLNFSSFLTHDSLMNIINGLWDLKHNYVVNGTGTLYSQSLYLGATNKAKLTPEEIAIATAKGWNVT